MSCEDVVSDFFELAERVVTYIKQCYEVHDDDELKDDLCVVLEQVLQYGVMTLENAVSMSNNDDFPLVVDELRVLAIALNAERETTTRVKKHGRPELNIDEERLSNLIELGFQTKDISAMFNCNRRTIERRMVKYGLSHFSCISDSELDDIVKEITTIYPHSGEKVITGRLRSQDIRVPRYRIRNSIQRVDPVGVLNRHKVILHRRKYQVSSPNALWHLDGYHKLASHRSWWNRWL